MDESERRLLDAIRNLKGEVNLDLDAALPDYAQAQLDGLDAAALFPEVHAYVLRSAHAFALCAALLDQGLELESDSLLAETASPVLNTPFVPDLSFLRPKGPSLEERVLAITQRIVDVLVPKADLALDLFADGYFATRARLPARMRLAELPSNAFGAAGGDIPDEIRWLEASYQVLRATDENPQADLGDLALTAATNAGLATALRTRFAAWWAAQGRAAEPNQPN